MSRLASCLMACVLPFLAVAETPSADVPAPRSSSEILWSMQKLGKLGRALYVAAHPDDENTALISYLSLGEKYDTAYLSLTRGDGGQNLIGAELSDELGVIRTQELLAARRLDGGQQFFSRARDFGFSKTSAETLRIWNEEQVLADMVWVIRSFRPDVIITRFRPEDSATHGHHTASARLAVKAFEVAADATQFPEQLEFVEPWQAKRVVWNTSSWFFRNNNQTFNEADYVSLDVGGYEPLLGKSYNEIASASRSMHRSQGFGSAVERGSRKEYFSQLAGSPTDGSLFDGVDTSWARVAGAEPVARAVASLADNYNPLRPADSVAGLLDLRERLTALGGWWAERKIAEIDNLIASCIGLSVIANAASPVVTLGESSLRFELETLQRSEIPVTLKSVALAGVDFSSVVNESLPYNVKRSLPFTVDLPASIAPSQPYWLKGAGDLGSFVAPELPLVGSPENAAQYVCSIVLSVGGKELRLTTPVVSRSVDPARGESFQVVRNAPAASVAVTPDVSLFPNGKSKHVTVQVDAVFEPVSGTLRLIAPKGWTVAPAEARVEQLDRGQKSATVFTVSPGNSEEPAVLRAELAGDDGRTYRQQLLRIRYDHIPEQFVFRDSATNAIPLSVAKKGERVAYIAGAGDSMPQSIEELGYSVTVLEPSQVSESSLNAFDSVVLGIRAYNTIEEIDRLMPELFAFVDRGGTVVAQYNTTGGLKTRRYAPYELSISRDRVTDENAPVTFLAPEHAVFKSPNAITESDFDGWKQERGLYFPNRWASEFTPLLSMADPGESPSEGSLLVTRFGKGYFVYTGISWFRQLPAGVPGAYRIFANLLSLGHE